ncbi:NAD(P)/FAD-dependent oxidoreductase [Luteolibacter yonseiensis]|uniref:NAD(P)/FAD-dependent oxidoreductase n=1 Tax=Luteolibacter yonseiensis TaxID=1144680 RepID=A0A934R602_9BACT|nr:NAD(P)/FAD-dependent oxidoreductase [Luteolibacter yonseiensis]MBK1817022.1 NAD(P)/FAD-dependent oxidoreductase [Luteolibacter yonseiensis]
MDTPHSSASPRPALIPMGKPRIHDVVIAGGGPAGLSAALLLGRCMRDVILCDGGNAEPGTFPSTGGFLGLDGCNPIDLIRVGREQCKKFDTVAHVDSSIGNVERSITGFRVHFTDGMVVETRSMLIASDLITSLPDITGAKEFHGTTFHQYPHCDGWDHRGQKLAVLGGGNHAVVLALKLLTWSDQVTLFTNGESICNSSRQHLAEKRIRVETRPVRALEGEGGILKQVRMADDGAVDCEALFYPTPAMPHSDLAARLGCHPGHSGRNSHSQTGCGTAVQGLFIVGNPSRPAEMAIISAAEGVKAAEAIHQWLSQADQSYLAVKIA